MYEVTFRTQVFDRDRVDILAPQPTHPKGGAVNLFAT